MTLVYIAIAWTLGLMAGAALHPSPPVLALATLWALAGLLLEAEHPHRRRIATLTLVLILGAWRWQMAQPRFGPHNLASYNDRGMVMVEGYVSAEPDIRSSRTQLQVTVERITLDDEPLDVRGKLLATVSLYPAYAYGDRVRCYGKLETPPILDDFDYREYLAARGVYSLMRWASIEPLQAYGGNPLLRALYQLKTTLRHRIDRILPHPEAGLLQGILLGLRHTLPHDLAQAFRVAGLSHIIVVSGFHVSTLMQAWFFGSRRWMHRWTSLGLGLGVLGLLVAFIGPSPSVMRAGLVGGLFMIAQLVGRRATPLASLAATALVMTAVNPLLLHSVGYQLSFAATLALVLLQPRLAEGVYARLYGGSDAAPAWTRILWEILLTTFAAQMVTLPIVWANFRQISTVALLANALVLPVLPLILIPGLLVTLLSLPAPGLARLAGYALWLPLRWITEVARTLSALPWASIPVPQLPPWIAWAFYAALLGIILKRPLRRTRSARRAAPAWRPLAGYAALALALVLVWSAVFALPDDKLRVYMLDVGQGDAMLIRTPEGHVVLIDGGPDPVLMSAHLGRKLAFWERRIDMIIVTHQDADHLAGLVPLVDRYQVAQIVQSSPVASSLLSAEWRRRLDAGEIVEHRVQRGDVLLLGDTRLSVLHPATYLEHNVPDDNDNSVVVMLEHGSFRMLFTGDIETRGERDLLSAGLDLSATVLKVSHHGSGTSSTAPFLARTAPQVAVIGVGADNRFGHPCPLVLERLEDLEVRVYRTDQVGTIELATDGRQLWIKTDR